MAFTEAEKSRIRHHLGYLNVGQVATFQLGIPSAVQTQFMIEGAFHRVTPAGETEVRRILEELNSYEAQMSDSKELRDVNQVGEIQVRPDAFNQLLREYDHWRQALGNCLGVPPNPYDFRFTMAGRPLNVPVSH
jgi:hypothetical protein